MKTNSSLVDHPQKGRRSLGDVVEWTVLFVLLVAGVFVFLNSNGFIDASGIQPYPY